VKRRASSYGAEDRAGKTTIVQEVRAKFHSCRFIRQNLQKPEDPHAWNLLEETEILDAINNALRHYYDNQRIEGGVDVATMTDKAKKKLFEKLVREGKTDTPLFERLVDSDDH